MEKHSKEEADADLVFCSEPSAKRVDRKVMKQPCS